MCWPSVRTPLLGCVRQRALLHREYGDIVIATAESYAARPPQPLARHHMMACISIALKWVEDEPLSRHCLFPGLCRHDLWRAEWWVLKHLKYELRVSR